MKLVLLSLSFCFVLGCAYQKKSTSSSIANGARSIASDDIIVKASNGVSTRQIKIPKYNATLGISATGNVAISLNDDDFSKNLYKKLPIKEVDDGSDIKKKDVTLADGTRVICGYSVIPSMIFFKTEGYDCYVIPKDHLGFSTDQIIQMSADTSVSADEIIDKANILISGLD